MSATLQLAGFSRAAFLAIVSFAAGVGVGIVVAESELRRLQEAGTAFDPLPGRAA